MGAVRYFVVQPYRVNDGIIRPDPAMEAGSASDAVYRARRIADEGGGAVAFSRVADPAAGEYWDAVVLGRFGQLPRDVL